MQRILFQSMIIAAMLATAPVPDATDFDKKLDNSGLRKKSETSASERLVSAALSVSAAHLLIGNSESAEGWLNLETAVDRFD